MNVEELKKHFAQAYDKRASRRVCGKPLDEVIFYHWLSDRDAEVCYCFLWACEGVEPELKSTLEMIRGQYDKFTSLLDEYVVGYVPWIELRNEAWEFLLQTPDLGPYYEQINYWPADPV